MPSFRRSVSTMFVVASLATLTSCGDDRPSARALGVGAYQAGLTNEHSSILCVGTLIRNAGLRDDTLRHIADGDLNGSNKTWNLGEDEGGPFEYWVEWKMPKKCHVEPWPGVDNWPDDPNRS